MPSSCPTGCTGTIVALPLSFSCPWTSAMISQTLSGYCSTIFVSTAPRWSPTSIFEG
jgi:hypothetical protein